MGPDKLSGNPWDSGMLPAVVVNSRERAGVLLLAEKTPFISNLQREWYKQKYWWKAEIKGKKKEK